MSLAVIVAPITAAPDGSEILPVIDAVASCAKPNCAQAVNSSDLDMTVNPNRVRPWNSLLFIYASRTPSSNCCSWATPNLRPGRPICRQAGVACPKQQRLGHTVPG